MLYTTVLFLFDRYLSMLSCVYFNSCILSISKSFVSLFCSTQHSPTCPVRLMDAHQSSSLSPEILDRGTKVGVSVLLQSKDNCVLLTRRAAHMRTFPSVWVPPGGHIGNQFKHLGSTYVIKTINCSYFFLPKAKVGLYFVIIWSPQISFTKNVPGISHFNQLLIRKVTTVHELKILKSDQFLTRVLVHVYTLSIYKQWNF